MNGTAVSDDFERAGGRKGLGWVLVVAGTLGLVTCMTLLFLATRAIMATGTGFVAVGGPYEIAHPAPGWIWIVPTSILSGVVFIALQWAGASRLQGFTVIMPMWVALFLALGENFLEMGVPTAATGGIAWIVCGVVFWGMAIMPLFAPIMARSNPAIAGSWMGFPGGGMTRQGSSAAVYSAVHIAAALAGIGAGVGLFSLLA